MASLAGLGGPTFQLAHDVVERFDLGGRIALELGDARLQRVVAAPIALVGLVEVGDLREFGLGGGEIPFAEMAAGEQDPVDVDLGERVLFAGELLQPLGVAESHGGNDGEPRWARWFEPHSSRWLRRGSTLVCAVNSR